MQHLRSAFSCVTCIFLVYTPTEYKWDIYNTKAREKNIHIFSTLALGWKERVGGGGAKGRQGGLVGVRLIYERLEN